MIVIDDRQAKIEVGSGAEGVMPDIAAGKILRQAVVPAMKEENVNQAVYGAVDMIYDCFTDPDVADELRSDRKEGPMSGVRVIDKDVIFNFLWVVALCAAVKIALENKALTLALLICFNAVKAEEFYCTRAAAGSIC